MLKYINGKENRKKSEAEPCVVLAVRTSQPQKYELIENCQKKEKKIAPYTSFRASISNQNILVFNN